MDSLTGRGRAYQVLVEEEEKRLRELIDNAQYAAARRTKANLRNILVVLGRSIPAHLQDRNVGDIQRERTIARHKAAMRRFQ